MSASPRRKDQGLGKTAAGGSSGSFASHSRAAAEPPKLVSTRYRVPTDAEYQRAAEALSETYPEIVEGLESPEGSFPYSAAQSALRWKIYGEPDELCKQVFDSNRMHYAMMDRGAPAPKRRKCAKCGIIPPEGTGRKVYWPPQDKTTAMCDGCASKAEFRPPMPEPTVPHYESRTETVL